MEEKDLEDGEQSIFVEYFGGSPYVKVLDFLIQGQEFDYSMTEIARGAKVGWSAFTKVWKKLLEKNIILATRSIGNAKLFRLNKTNPIVEKLIKLDWEITKFETAKFLKQEYNKKIKVPA
jgi:DNA-binding transcriptional ArsR family regulator